MTVEAETIDSRKQCPFLDRSGSYCGYSLMRCGQELGHSVPIDCPLKKRKVIVCLTTKLGGYKRGED